MMGVIPVFVDIARMDVLNVIITADSQEKLFCQMKPFKPKIGSKIFKLSDETQKNIFYIIFENGIMSFEIIF